MEKISEHIEDLISSLEESSEENKKSKVEEDSGLPADFEDLTKEQRIRLTLAGSFVAEFVHENAGEDKLMHFICSRLVKYFMTLEKEKFDKIMSFLHLEEEEELCMINKLDFFGVTFEPVFQIRHSTISQTEVNIL